MLARLDVLTSFARIVFYHNGLNNAIGMPLKNTGSLALDNIEHISLCIRAAWELRLELVNYCVGGPDAGVTNVGRTSCSSCSYTLGECLGVTFPSARFSSG